MSDSASDSVSDSVSDLVSDSVSESVHYGETIEIAVSINCPDPQNV